MKSGTLIYDNIRFYFVLDNSRNLELTPFDEDKDKCKQLFRKPLMTIDKSIDAYTFDSHIIEQKFLCGYCPRKKANIIFFLEDGTISSQNYVLRLKINGYLCTERDNTKISKITFFSKELNYIYNTRNVFKTKIYNLDDSCNIELKPYEETLSKKFKFNHRGKSVLCSFNIRKFISRKFNTPLTVASTMSFEFEETDEYEFILNLYFIAKRFIQFLTFRNNIEFDQIDVLNCFRNDYRKNGYLVMYENIIKENEEIISERYIPLEYIYDSIENIFGEVINNEIYTKHYPHSYELSTEITAASFILTTSAFEWEFYKLYPNGINKSEKRQNAIDSVKEKLNNLYNESTGREKKIYKSLKDFVYLEGLDNKINYVLKEFENMLHIFAEQLYKDNYNVAKISERIKEQRNIYAHGKLNMEFNEEVVKDIIYLEKVIYCMQLKRIGVSETNIKKSINKLFDCNLLI